MKNNYINFKKKITDLTHSPLLCDDKYLDRLILGVEINSLDAKELFHLNINEQITHEPTPYHFIATFLNFIQPKENSIVYDLGSGYGRVVLFGAIVSDAKFIGIELIKERVDFAKKRQEILGLQNADFVQMNVKDASLFHGDIFFLFNPFLEPTLNKVGDNLAKVSRHKRICIVCWGGMGIYNYFQRQQWLIQIHPPKQIKIEKLSFFYSL